MKYFLVVLSLVLVFTAVQAQKVDVKEMVKKADLLLRGENSSNQFVDFVVHRPGNVVTRKMINYQYTAEYSLTHTLTPLRDRDGILLKRKYDLWMFDPKLRKSIRIPFSIMHQGLYGSDFTYDDIAKVTNWSDDYKPKLRGVSKKMTEEHKSKVYIVDLTPLPGRPIAYKRLRLWIRAEGNITIRAQFYNNDMKVDRIMNLTDIKKVDDREMPTKWTMVNLLKKGYYSIWHIKNARYNDIKDDKMFNKRSLENPPTPTWEKKASR